MGILSPLKRAYRAVFPRPTNVHYYSHRDIEKINERGNEPLRFPTVFAQLVTEIYGWDGKRERAPSLSRGRRNGFCSLLLYV